MIELELDEVRPPSEWSLSADQGRLLAASGVVSAVPSPFRSGAWLVGADGKVGTVRVGDVVVRIQPKVSISRLLFLVGYSLHGAAWQASTVDIDESADLIPAVAQALWRQVARAIHQGLLPGYVAVEESSPVLRGRLRESAQLAMHHGLPLPLEIRHDEFTVDIAENQILRTACERMLLVPRVDEESSRMLRRLLRDFSDVRSVDRGDPVPPWQPTRLNARYHAALRLAELVLRATSVDQGTGAVAVNGFLLAMPQLFEDFVTVALKESLESTFGGHVEAQSRHYLDVAGKVPLKPDIVWQVGDATVAVIDAKYKAEKPSGYPNADLYQLLTYCTVLGLRVGHLVYAAGNEQPARHVVREAYTEIICHALDLSQSPDALLGEVSSLAAHVAAERGIETQTSASQPLLPFSAALFEAWHNPSQWISARRRDRALSMSVIGAFSWRWPEGIESYERGWVAIADVDGTQFQIRHGIGHRDAFGRSRIRTVTWVEGEPLVEGVEADDFDQSQALLSLIKITKKPCS